MIGCVIGLVPGGEDFRPVYWIGDSPEKFLVASNPGLEIQQEVGSLNCFNILCPLSADKQKGDK
jgi:hypothetical protein